MLDNSSFDVPTNIPENTPPPHSDRVALGLWIALTIGFLALGVGAFSRAVNMEHSNAQNAGPVHHPTTTGAGDRGK